MDQLVSEKNPDLLLLCEQYRDRDSGWFVDSLGTAAIWIPDVGKVSVEAYESKAGYVWIESRGTAYFSCYFTPNESIHEFRRKLNSLEDDIRVRGGRILVVGDLNAKAVEWGMPVTDMRGRLIVEMAARTELVVLNEGSTSTFRRPGYTETIPDISLASEGLAARVRGWRVIEDFTGSDHQYKKLQE
ncbi:uncharacterized protein [Rhodnius prolixus]|uniref:uncharacterized protein n=1 Tax=Rhodnius prolixus TaxID=13249 RepID=UPI003D18C5EC